MGLRYGNAVRVPWTTGGGNGYVLLVKKNHGGLSADIHVVVSDQEAAQKGLQPLHLLLCVGVLGNDLHLATLEIGKHRPEIFYLTENLLHFPSMFLH